MTFYIAQMHIPTIFDMAVRRSVGLICWRSRPSYPRGYFKIIFTKAGVSSRWQALTFRMIELLGEREGSSSSNTMTTKTREIGRPWIISRHPGRIPLTFVTKAAMEETPLLVTSHPRRPLRQLWSIRLLTGDGQVRQSVRRIERGCDFRLVPLYHRTGFGTHDQCSPI